MSLQEKKMSRQSSLRKLFSRTSSDRDLDIDDVNETLTKSSKSYKKLQRQILETYPGLTLSPLRTDWARNLIAFGANSVKKEVQDLNIMHVVMQENEKMLTHAAVERFFDWIPPFRDYLEQYFYLEEDILFKLIEAKVGKLTGILRLSNRMKVRGSMRLKLQELMEVQDKFTTSLPAGQRVHFTTKAVNHFTESVIEYFGQLGEILPPLVKINFKKKEVLIIRIKWVKNVTSHVGADEFLAIYTRWLSQKELLEWRTRILLPSDFTFRVCRSWKKDLNYKHFRIAKSFQEDLDVENADDLQQYEQARVDFQKAQIVQRQRRLAMRASEDMESKKTCGNEEDLPVEI